MEHRSKKQNCTCLHAHTTTCARTHTHLEFSVQRSGSSLRVKGAVDKDHTKEV